MAILAKNGQILTIFGQNEGQKIFSTKKFFSGHLSHMETPLGAKNQKKYRTIKAVGLERTYARTDARTDARESKDIRGTKKNNTVRKLLHQSFRKYIYSLYSDQVLSPEQASNAFLPKEVQIWTKKGLKRAGSDFPGL